MPTANAVCVNEMMPITLDTGFSLSLKPYVISSCGGKALWILSNLVFLALVTRLSRFRTALGKCILCFGSHTDLKQTLHCLQISVTVEILDESVKAFLFI